MAGLRTERALSDRMEMKGAPAWVLGLALPPSLPLPQAIPPPLLPLPACSLLAAQFVKDIMQMGFMLIQPLSCLQAGLLNPN